MSTNLKHIFCVENESRNHFFFNSKSFERNTWLFVNRERSKRVPRHDGEGRAPRAQNLQNFNFSLQRPREIHEGRT